MTDGDTRSLPAAAQATLRSRAVRAVLEGMTQAEAARVFGVHHNAVNRWIKRYRQGGWAGLSERRRGRRPGEQAALSESQQQELMALVRETTPDQLGLGGVWGGGAAPPAGWGRPPCPNPSSRSLWHWSARPRPISSAWRGFCGPAM